MAVVKFPQSVKKSEWEKEIQDLKEDLGDLQKYIEEFTAFLPLAVCTSSPIGIIIDINKAFQNLTGFKEIEIIGKSLKTLFLEKEKLEKALEETFEKGVIRDRELTLLSKEKKEIPVNISLSTRKDASGNFIGYFLALSDITEMKQYREELEKRVKERTKELQERVDELERLQQITVGRELKMIELKEALKQAQDEIKKLKEVEKND